MVKKQSKKQPKMAHTPRSAKGLGDFYGTGIRQPLGRVRDDTVGMVHLSKEKLKNPPKTLA